MRRLLRSNELEHLEFKLEKILGFRNMQEKLEKAVFSSHFSYIGDVKLLKIVI